MQSPEAQTGSGTDNLRNLVADLERSFDLPRNAYPIVLVPGFTGFGEPVFGSINYWGGFEDLAGELHAHGRVPIIIPRIGPISSNWERACELYAQLHEIQRTTQGAGFERRGTLPVPNTPSIRVDYGSYIRFPTGTPRLTKRALVLGNLDHDWQWDADHPVHMICHSQGGNTVRLLIELLSGRHASLHPDYFAPPSRQSLIKSVVTLGTPYLGTTITSVIFDILSRMDVTEVISRLVVSASLNPSRFVDLQLGQWGFTPNVNETFISMHNRLKSDIRSWWDSENNGIKDNGVAGIARLSKDFKPQASHNTSYFTFSFDATRPFPEGENLTPKEVASLPTHSLISPFRSISPGAWDLAASAVSVVPLAVHTIYSAVPGNPSDLQWAKWFISVLNNHASDLGYRFRIPTPGTRIPRADMLPLLSIFSLGMSGLEDLGAENDGVVETRSMVAPEGARVGQITRFYRQAPTCAQNKGVYWHFGANEGIDHADQVGVFTNDDTYRNVAEMYRDIGRLMAYL